MTWKEIAAGGVAGTGRSGVSDDDFLRELAMGTALRRAGLRPLLSEPTGPASPPDAVPPYDSGADLLRECLATDDRLVVEWCRTASERGWRAPDDILPDLLAAAVKRKAGSGEALQAVGARGRWLAGLNPKWGELFEGETQDGDQDPNTRWAEGTRDKRLSLLSRIGAAGARALLESTWKEDSARERAAFLEVLGEKKDAASAEFFRNCLQDRSSEVRGTAAVGLSRVSGDPFAVEALALAKEFVSFGWRTRIDLPEGDDPRFEAFGIAPLKPPMTPDQRMARLTRLVAMIPPSLWDASASLLRKLPADAHGRAVRDGWRQATLTHGDRTWAAALSTEQPDSELTPLLSRALREEIALRLLRDSRLNYSGQIGSFAHSGEPWSPDFTREFLKLVSELFRGRNVPLVPDLVRDAAFYMDSAAAQIPQVEPPPGWGGTIDRWQRILLLRRSIGQIPHRSNHP